MNHENPILSFARDFSGDDAAITAQVEAWIANPPEDQETVGFYGGDDYEPTTRSFLATVVLLRNQDKICSAEDKYLIEIFGRWRDDGVIDPTALPPAVKAVFGPFITQDEIPDLSDEDTTSAYRRTVWSLYAQATEELEQHIGSRGRVLLSIDATDGDTMFFALVKREIAQRWRDKALSEQDGYRAGVRSPMWDRFWDYMGYALGPYWATEDHEGYPPGTRMRSETIPFAE
ncbi:hypothetical protein Q2941_06365 [Bradyrhizobium sp. UFLA05-153]